MYIHLSKYFQKHNLTPMLLTNGGDTYSRVELFMRKFILLYRVNISFFIKVTACREKKKNG